MNLKEYKNILQFNDKKESQEEAADSKEFGFSVEIDKEVFDKIMYWIDKAPGEISGLGKLIHDANSNTLRVVSAILLPQKNTAASTEIDGHAIGKAMFQLKDSPGTLQWWWHSHVNMDVFWSGTDVATIKQLGSNGWFLSTVFNKRREMKTAYCQASPVRLIVDDLDTEVRSVVQPELMATWDEEYTKNIKQETASIVHKKSFMGYGRSLWDDVADNDAGRYGGSKKNLKEKEPESADIFPKEADGDLSEEEMLAYLTLGELYEMKRDGKVSDKLFQEAVETATEDELSEFFKSNNFNHASVTESEWE